MNRGEIILQREGAPAEQEGSVSQQRLVELFAALIIQTNTLLMPVENNCA